MPKSQKRAQPASSTGPLILIAVGAVLILIVLILTLINSQAGGTQANVQPTAISDIPYPEIDRVSLADALTAFNANTAIFVDVRSADSFNRLSRSNQPSQSLSGMPGSFPTAPDQRNNPALVQRVYCWMPVLLGYNPSWAGWARGQTQATQLNLN